MDNRKLDIIIGLYDEPVIVDKSSDNGDEVARIYTTGDDDFDNSDRIPLGEELVKRWNAYPELVAKLKAFIECARWEEANQDSLNSALMNYAQHADDARTLLQTLKA